MYYRNNIVNLSFIERYKVLLDNELAAQDRIRFDDVVNGVYIDPTDLNINSTVKFITVVRKYESSDEYERVKESIPQAYSDGIYCGFVMLDSILDRSNKIKVKEGYTAYGIRFNLNQNIIQFFASDIDQTSNDALVRYDMAFDEAEDKFPCDYIIRMYDIKRNLIQESEITVVGPNTIEDIPLKRNTYIQYMENHDIGNDQIDWLPVRNFDIEFNYINISFVYEVMGEKNSVDVMLNEFVLNGDMEIDIVKKPGYSILTFIISSNVMYTTGKVVVNLYYPDNQGNPRIQPFQYYGYKMIKDEEIQDIVDNINDVYLNIIGMDIGGFCWICKEDIEPYSKTDRFMRAQFYLGNKIVYPNANN